MFKSFAFAIAAVLLLSAVSVASAGGWAVVTLDRPLSNVVANEPVTAAMMIRQHGKTPWVYDNVRVKGTALTGESFTTAAVMDQPGHYTSELTFTKPGTWHWAVASGLMPEWQPMPDVEVADPAQLESALASAETARVATPSASPLAPNPNLLIAGLIGLIAFGGGVTWWWRSRRAV